MKLRVAHVLRKYDPASWGGTETHVAALATRQAAEGVSVEVHAPKGPTGDDFALPASVVLRRYRAFCPFIGRADRRASLVSNAGNLGTIDEPLRLVCDRTLDLAHVHTQGRVGGSVRAAMRLTGRPYVVSVHGPLLAHPELLRRDTEQRLSGLVDLGQPLGWLLGSRRVIDDAARVLCFNEEELRALQTRVGERALLLDQGVELARFASASEERARARWPELSSNDPIVLLVGRLSDQKNQLAAVRAISSVANARLVLAGAETDRGYGAKIAEEARSLGLADRVHVLGNVDPLRDLPDLLALATLVVMPSKHEAFGLIALEAWASGKPALLAAHSGLARLGRAFGDDSWMVGSLDPRAWAAAIEAALKDPERRRHAAHRGRALVQSRFDWGVVSKSISATYQTVLQEHRRTQPGRGVNP
jgi:glycosyltransferase involved in cell wall biosynthesis